MLDVRYSHLYFYQSLNRLQRGLSAIAELLVPSVYLQCSPAGDMQLAFVCTSCPSIVRDVSINRT